MCVVCGKCVNKFIKLEIKVSLPITPHMHKLGNGRLDVHVRVYTHTHYETSEHTTIKNQTHNGSEEFLVLYVLFHYGLGSEKTTCTLHCVTLCLLYRQEVVTRTPQFRLRLRYVMP